MTLLESNIFFILLGVVLAILAVLICFLITRKVFKHQLLQAEQKNQLLQQEHDQLKAELGETHQQQRELSKSNNDLEKQLSVLQSQYQHVQQRLTELQDNERQLKSELQRELQQKQDALANDKSSQTKIAGLKEKLEEQSLAINHWQNRWDKLHTENTRLVEENVQLSSSVEERKRSLQEQQELFNQQKKDLSDRFQLLANEILEKKSQALTENNKQGLHSVINPFQQSINAFKKEVQDIHHRESTQRSELKKELEHLKALNQQITTEAHELSTALKGQKKIQGNWGELVLENVLDRSGLQLGKDYQREASFRTEAGRQRPDVLVHLPQDKHLIIDAKVSLNAYTRYINSEEEQDRQLALADHVQAMRDRIKELADRDYYKIPGLNSPEVVFMFVPIESAFVEALKADESLFQNAIEQNVLVATPTTLLTSLNIVRQLWRYEDQNKHTAALAKKAEGVFNKLNTFLKSFEDVKKGLDKAGEAYSKAENQLLSGKGNLVKQVGEFKNLAPAIKSELPGYFVEKAELEVDFIAKDETDAESSNEADSRAHGHKDHNVQQQPLDENQ